MSTIKFKTDCRRFKGDIPCEMNKLHGITCDDCDYYKPTLERILIIKLGGMGDVIRTTPLLRVLKKTRPKAEIWWLTRHPEVVPVYDGYVDNVLSFNLEGILQIQATEFSMAYNLDKDREACALMNQIMAPIKKGFFLGNGKLAYYSNAEHKFETGIDDNLSKQNQKNYQEEIFEMCGFRFLGEEYIIDKNKTRAQWNIQHLKNKKIIGLNIGCGDRWRSRQWKTEYWIELAEGLRREGHEVILLGGEQEHEINKAITKKSGVLYFGFFPFKDFVNLVDHCDLVVSAATLGVHVALGLEKKVILLNNIFNKYEFYLYNRGKILEPDKKCKCYYEQECKNLEYFCMDFLKPKEVFKAIKELF